MGNNLPGYTVRRLYPIEATEFQHWSQYAYLYDTRSIRGLLIIYIKETGLISRFFFFFYYIGNDILKTIEKGDYVRSLNKTDWFTLFFNRRGANILRGQRVVFWEGKISSKDKVQDMNLTIKFNFNKAYPQGRAGGGIVRTEESIMDMTELNEEVYSKQFASFIKVWLKKSVIVRDILDAYNGVVDRDYIMKRILVELLSPTKGLTTMDAVGYYILQDIKARTDNLLNPID